VKIIPVIDLKGGVVVHAKLGQRKHYQPIASALCQSCQLEDVIEAFLGLYAFDTFYVADLDAITGIGDHHHTINRLLNRFPQLKFWLDQGYVTVEQTLDYAPNCVPVLGSEVYLDGKMAELAFFNHHFVLSLDYNHNRFMGDAALLTDSRLWPENVIIMTLGQVGSMAGPDATKLKHFRQHYPTKNFVAAGGVRGIEDLLTLQTLGIGQVLVASALHSAKLKTADIQHLT
jgi:phosphoribosylformimino-5-aminoimidazole carboxamide ribotide isomerase